VRNILRYVGGWPIGAKMPVTLFRDGQVITLPVTIVESAETLAMTGARMAAMPAPAPVSRDLGLDVSPITPELREKYALAVDQTGIVVTGVKPHSAADDLGFKPGMVPLMLQGKSVTSLDDIRQIVDAARAEKRQHVLVLLSDGGKLTWLAVPIPPAT
jgi:serine protease Do